MSILSETPLALLIIGAVLLGLYLANMMYDNNIPQYISRKLGHLAGCFAFLMCPFLFSSFWWPFIITVGFTILLVYARWFRPNLFRGVGGAGRPTALAEIHFPATGIVLIGILWGIVNEPWLAIIPLCFMGGGDAVTGIIRARMYGREMKGNWGSVGMLVTCLILAYLIQPYWLGATGAAVAVIAERFTKTTRFVDDNLTIPLSSALIMGGLYVLV